VPYSAELITKTFAGVCVVDRVSFDIREGMIRGLIGENGAGKSTLLKVMAGVHRPDGGRLLLDGEPISFGSIQDAITHGVYLVPQEPSLLPDLSIAENISLGSLSLARTRFGRIDWRQVERRARDSLEQLGFTVDVRLPASALSIASQQLVECARALAFGCRFIFFDEPTSPLSTTEVDMLAERLRALRDKGHGIVLISHRLSELTSLSDSITVLRDAKRVGADISPPYSNARLVKDMIGRELANDAPVVPFGRAGGSDVVLQVSKLASPPEVQDVSFDVRVGEVVGLAGLVGSGRTEASECIVGLRTRRAGDILYQGRPLSRSTTDIYRDGIVYVSEDRARNGSFLRLAISSNITAGIIDRLGWRGRNGIISRAREQRAVRDSVKNVDVRAMSTSALLGSLSGGNQQKCLIARALLIEPKVLLLDEPTRGVDIGAKQAIHAIIQRLAGEGLAVIVISSELEEVTHLADRIVVFYEGATVASITRERDGSWDRATLGRAVLGELAAVQNDRNPEPTQTATHRGRS